MGTLRYLSTAILAEPNDHEWKLVQSCAQHAKELPPMGPSWRRGVLRSRGLGSAAGPRPGSFGLHVERRYPVFTPSLAFEATQEQVFSGNGDAHVLLEALHEGPGPSMDSTKKETSCIIVQRMTQLAAKTAECDTD